MAPGASQDSITAALCASRPCCLQARTASRATVPRARLTPVLCAWLRAPRGHYIRSLAILGITLHTPHASSQKCEGDFYPLPLTRFQSLSGPLFLCIFCRLSPSLVNVSLINLQIPAVSFLRLHFACLHHAPLVSSCTTSSTFPCSFFQHFSALNPSSSSSTTPGDTK